HLDQLAHLRHRARPQPGPHRVAAGRRLQPLRARALCGGACARAGRSLRTMALNDLAFKDLALSEFTERLARVRSDTVLMEFAALAFCLLLAWGICRWFGRDQPKESIWFGARTLDGLLFPLLALLFTVLARRIALEVQPVLVLRIAVSLLLSLVVIRFFA